MSFYNISMSIELLINLFVLYIKKIYYIVINYIKYHILKKISH